MATPVKVIGIDPGTRSAGWAVVSRAGQAFRLHDCGVVRARGAAGAERLGAIMAGLRDAVTASGATEAAVEAAFAGRNVSTALKIGEARGVALAVLGQAGLPVTSYAARRIKRAVTGFGGADKTQVARMVAMQLGLSAVPGPDDVTDACAVAITHLILRDAPK
jgi:crossover junction endodeoxyribonuclease RuvC